MARRVSAITFDIWDTLLLDGSDEPKRKEMGLPSKPEARRRLVADALGRYGPVDRSVVDAAYGAADRACAHVWKELFVTWPVIRRLEIVLAGVGRGLPEEDFEALVRAHETMELEVGVDAVEGASETLSELARRYPLAVISDTVFTPGWALRKILEEHGLAQYFRAFVFSDEIGHSKPHPEVFLAAAEGLGVPVSEMVHVGDRGGNDVQGIHAVGGLAVLFTGVTEARIEGAKPDAWCRRLADLPGIIRMLEAS